MVENKNCYINNHIIILNCHILCVLILRMVYIRLSHNKLLHFIFPCFSVYLDKYFINLVLNDYNFKVK